MKVGQFDIKVTSARVGGGWQAVGILPDGKQVISGPSKSREDAEADIEQQAKAHIYQQRRYDVNRPFESMSMNENKWIKNAVNHEHNGYRTPQRKALLHQEGRKYPEISESDEAVVLHKANQLLEEMPIRLGPRYEIGSEGEDLGSVPDQPECPVCGSAGRALGSKYGMDYYFCDHCRQEFKQLPGEHKMTPPPKASFYPSDGGSAGGGGGMTTA